MRNPNCTRCDLHEGAHTVCLWGRGTPGGLLIFGQNPGANEDREGAVFIGRSGKLLDMYLRVSGLEKHPVYISNVVKCLTPENRPPSSLECKACRVYGADEIVDCAPKVILCLGRVAAESILGRNIGPLSGARGKRFEFGGIPLLVTYHPAFLMRPQGRRLVDEVTEDYRRVEALLSGTLPEGDAEIVKGWECAPISLLAAGSLIVDIETTCLNPRDDAAKILLVGVADAAVPRRVFCFRKTCGDLKHVLHHAKKIIGHNLKFDASWLKIHWGIDLFDKEWFDTYTACGLIFPESPSLSLKVIGPTVTGIPYDETLKDFDPEDPANLERLLSYCGKDVYITGLVHDWCRLRLAKRRPLLDFAQELTRTVAKMQLLGVRIDMDAFKELAKAVHERLDTAAGALGEIPDDFDVGLKQKKDGSWGLSTKKTHEYIFSILGLPVVKMTAKRKPSLDEEARDELEKFDKTGFVKQYGVFRKAQKLLGTYILGIQKHTTLPRLYPEFHIVKGERGGTVSGRITITKPALQTTPRNDPELASRFKNIYVARTPGNLVISADLAQIELRVAADLANDSAMLAIFNEGRDPHAEFAAKLFGCPPEDVDVEMRQRGKTANFQIIYGCTPYGLQMKLAESGIEETVPACQDIIDRWYAMFPGVKEWQAEWIARARATMRVQTPLGRVRTVPNIRQRGPASKHEEREALNFPIQGGATEILNVGLVMAERLTTWESMGKLAPMFLVYDSIVFDAGTSDPAVAERKGTAIQRWFLEEVPKYIAHFEWKLKVPIVMDVKIGECWT